MIDARKDENMTIIKELLFWWLLIDAVILSISKKWRKDRIDYLKRLDKTDNKFRAKY
ncbi:MAG: hypothetical protein RR673_03730 [Erysipelotrichaceae bacterium]